MSAAGGASELLAQLPEQSGDAAAAVWLTILGRAAARGEASPEALHPRVATVAIVPTPRHHRFLLLSDFPQAEGKRPSIPPAITRLPALPRVPALADLR
jgi:hypothetical protein